MASAAQTIRRLPRWVWMLGAALVLALVCTLITWPGIFYSDSYGRWQMARDLTRLQFDTQDDWLSAPPQLFMAVVYKLSGGSYGVYTFLQAACFFFTAFFTIDAFVPRGRWAAWVLFAACPVFYGFSVYLEMSVGCVTALLWLLWLVLCVDHGCIKVWKKSRLVLYFLLCCFLYFVLLGFRQNAFTVLPVLAFALFLLCRRAGSAWPAVLHGMAVVLALVVIAAIPKVLRFGYQWGGASSSVGFLWETVSMLEELQGDARYDTMLDYLGEEGTTRQAIEGNNYDSIYGYHDAIPNSAVGTGDNAARIRQDYFRLLREQPGTFFTVKARFWARTMGVNQPLSAGEYDYNRDGRMAEFGYRDTAARRAFFGSYHGFLEAFSVLRRPWVAFAAALALLLPGHRALEKAARTRLWLLYATAVFYYGSFLVTTQSQEFRYFFVPLVLLYLVAAGCVGALAGTLWDRRKTKQDHSRHLQEENA